MFLNFSQIYSKNKHSIMQKMAPISRHDFLKFNIREQRPIVMTSAATAYTAAMMMAATAVSIAMLLS
jgi:hypothetical protein